MTKRLQMSYKFIKIWQIITEIREFMRRLQKKRKLEMSDLPPKRSPVIMLVDGLERGINGQKNL